VAIEIGQIHLIDTEEERGDKIHETIRGLFHIAILHAIQRKILILIHVNLI
jgi:hypothetical protein